MKAVALGALYGATAVALGAVGAHALGPDIVAEQRASFELAVNYQLLHGIALVAIGGSSERLFKPLQIAAAWAIGLGVLLFCGSIYARTFGGPAEIATAAPFGGTLLIVGWLLLALAAIRAR